MSQDLPDGFHHNQLSSEESKCLDPDYIVVRESELKYYKV